LKKSSSALKPSPDHHLDGMGEHNADDRPAPQQGTRTSRLQRKKERALFKKKSSFQILPSRGSCHRNRTARKGSVGELGRQFCLLLLILKLQRARPPSHPPPATMAAGDERERGRR
jgi:hypothetical protein